MASVKRGNYVVVLVPFGSASEGDVQFAQSEAQYGKVWFPARGILRNETHVAKGTRVMLRETGLPFSRYDLQLVRDEVLSITLADGKK
jgi:hypothetical protein